MVTHQTPCPDRPIEALSNPAQVVDKLLTGSIVENNILARVPARHHMVKSAFKLDSKWAGDGPSLAGEVGLITLHDPSARSAHAAISVIVYAPAE